MANKIRDWHWISVMRLRATTVLALAVVLVPAVVATPSAQAQSFRVLYSFTGIGGDGEYPIAGFIQDAAGNLYSTTYQGGAYGWGTVFEVDKIGNEKVLHSFNEGDGAYPGAGLAQDAAGNLYGTTTVGGAYNQGTVFKVDKNGREKVLHSFSGTAGDGANPNASLVLDTAGNLYGTTTLGGAYGYGSVFVVIKSGGEKVLHSFAGFGGDGANPYASLVLDTAGNLYGTTNGGGAYGYGTVFVVNKSGEEKVMYSFTGISGDGANPYASLVRDAAGNLYGTTLLGGTYNYGTVFVLDKAGREKVIYSFTFAGVNGDGPSAGLIQDTAGNLYGTDQWGGDYGLGSVFVVNKSGEENVLHSFAGSDGKWLYSGLAQDAAGNLYGTTVYGGAYGWGTVFEVRP
jgi:uncharacterized repeat protein (TIGR03803 family)